MYNFRTDPRQANVSLLLSVDQDSYQDPYKDAQTAKQGSPHPIAWYRDGNRLGPNATALAPYGEDQSAVDGILGAAVPSLDVGFVMPGRMWYTALGHTIEIWSDPLFVQHIQGGLNYTLGTERLNATVTSDVSDAPAPSASAGIGPAAAGSDGAAPTAATSGSRSTTSLASTALLGLLSLSMFL